MLNPHYLGETVRTNWNGAMRKVCGRIFLERILFALCRTLSRTVSPEDDGYVAQRELKQHVMAL